MSCNTTLDFQRGQTLYAGDPPSTINPKLLGKEVQIEDKRYGTGRMVTLRAVKNSSTISLLPKRLVRFKQSAPFGTEVDGYAHAIDERAVVVDEELPSTGVEPGDVFWVVVKGPALTEVVDAGINTVAVGDVVVPIAAAASTVGTTAGRVGLYAAAGTNTSTYINDTVNYIRYAVGCAGSGKTTGTSGDLLVMVGELF